MLSWKKPKLSYSLIRTIIISVISTIIFINLNGVFAAFIGINAPFSPLILLLCILLLFISKVNYSSFNFSIKLMLVFMLSFVVFGTISSIFYHQYLDFPLEVIKDEFRYILTSILLIIVYYVYCIQLDSEKKLSNFILFLGIIFFVTQLGGIVESVFGLQNNFYAKANATLQGERSLGFFGNPNETGFQANLTFILGAYLFLKKKIPLWAFVIFLVSSFAASIYSFSKMAIIIKVINIICFFLYSAFYLRGLKKAVRRKFILFSIAFFSIAVLFIVPAFIDFYINLEYSQRRRIDAIYELVIEGKINRETTSERSDVAIEAIELISQKPLLGYGMQSFSTGTLFSGDFGAHNMYFKILGEAGIVPFSLMIIVLFHLIYAALFKQVVPERYFILAFVGFFLAASVASHTLLNRKFIVPLFGIVFALVAFRQQQKNNA